MPHTIYVVHGFRGGRKAITQCFSSEELARTRAALLGQSCDGVLLWRQTTDMDTGIHDGPSVLLNMGNAA